MSKTKFVETFYWTICFGFWSTSFQHWRTLVLNQYCWQESILNPALSAPVHCSLINPLLMLPFRSHPPTFLSTEKIKNIRNEILFENPPILIKKTQQFYY